jgi:hypothetical protein
MGGLDSISAQVTKDGFASEYDFEFAISQFLQTAHDGHLSFRLPASTAFQFITPFDFVSISPDGTALPEIYVQRKKKKFLYFSSLQYANLPSTEDIKLSISSHNLSWTPSAVKSINGKAPIDYFTPYAQRVSGQLGPHAD